MHAKIIAGALLAALSGCSTLTPTTIRPEFTHMSHLSQHFGDHPTNYGSNAFDVAAHWDFGHVAVELAEGFSVDRHYPGVNATCGEIEGPREQTTLRVGYSFNIK